MKTAKWLWAGVLCLGALQCGTVMASDNDVVVKADSPANLAAVAAAVDKQMATGGRWEFVGAGERSTIRERFHDMSVLFDKYGSLDKMDQNVKDRMASDQEAINTILTQRDGDRKVCTSERPTGSNILRTTCRTYAQTQRDQQDTQRFLMDHNGTMQRKTGGG